jgi:hypothetical protein
MFPDRNNWKALILYTNVLKDLDSSICEYSTYVANIFECLLCIRHFTESNDVVFIIKELSMQQFE